VTACRPAARVEGWLFLLKGVAESFVRLAMDSDVSDLSITARSPLVASSEIICEYEAVAVS
jgi:hypothetical protein